MPFGRILYEEIFNKYHRLTKDMNVCDVRCFLQVLEYFDVVHSQDLHLCNRLNILRQKIVLLREPRREDRIGLKVEHLLRFSKFDS